MNELLRTGQRGPRRFSSRAAAAINASQFVALVLKMALMLSSDRNAATPSHLGTLPCSPRKRAPLQGQLPAPGGKQGSVPRSIT